MLKGALTVAPVSVETAVIFVDRVIFTSCCLLLDLSLSNEQLLIVLLLAHGNECLSTGDLLEMADMYRYVWTAYFSAYFHIFFIAVVK